MMRTKNNDQETPSAKARHGKARLIGLGLDDAGGHVRYTRDAACELIGGSERIHREMQERAARIRREIEDLGISLEHMTYEQYQQVRVIVDRENDAAIGY